MPTRERERERERERGREGGREGGRGGGREEGREGGREGGRKGERERPTRNVTYMHMERPIATQPAHNDERHHATIEAFSHVSYTHCNVKRERQSTD